MLVGLAAKNAILIVEFAEQLRERGASVVEAAIEASRLRLRPILMTSLAFILGVLPLVFATGAGREARNSVGTAVSGGMLVSTFLNLIFIPVLYVVVQTVRGVGRGKPKPQEPRRFLDSFSKARSTLTGLFSRKCATEGRASARPVRLCSGWTGLPEAPDGRIQERVAGLVSEW